eukprot:536128_1
MADWTELSNPMFTSNDTIQHVVKRNAAELLIFIDSNLCRTSTLSSIWRYNICDDTYKEFIPTNSLKFKHSIIDYSVAMDQQNDTLWIYTQARRLISINMTTNKITTDYNTQWHTGKMHICCSENNLHLIETYNNIHWTWDSRTKSLVKKSDLSYITNNLQCYLYSLTNNKYDVSNITIRSNLLNPKGVVTRDLRYCIFLNQQNRNILIIDMHLKISTTSAFATLFENMCPAIHSDHVKDELLTFGFIRNCWNSPDFATLLFPPYVLIKNIDQCYINEKIYITNTNINYCMNIDKIIERLIKYP